MDLFWEPMNPGRVVCLNHGSMRIERHDKISKADIAVMKRDFGMDITCEDSSRGNCGGSL